MMHVPKSNQRDLPLLHSCSVQSIPQILIPKVACTVSAKTSATLLNPYYLLTHVYHILTSDMRLSSLT